MKVTVIRGNTLVIVSLRRYVVCFNDKSDGLNRGSSGGGLRFVGPSQGYPEVLIVTRLASEVDARFF